MGITTEMSRPLITGAPYYEPVLRGAACRLPLYVEPESAPLPVPARLQVTAGIDAGSARLHPAGGALDGQRPYRGCACERAAGHSAQGIHNLWRTCSTSRRVRLYPPVTG